MTSTDSSGRSADLTRLVQRLKAERGLDPNRLHAQPAHVQERLAAIKQRVQAQRCCPASAYEIDHLATQQTQWEATALGAAADILQRARRIADLEVAAAIQRAKERADEIVRNAAQTAAGRYLATLTNSSGMPINTAVPHRAIRSGTAVQRVSQHNTHGYAARHHLDQTLQKAGAERARILANAAAEAHTEQERILDETHTQVQRMLEEARREADAITQAARLRALTGWRSQAERPPVEPAPIRRHTVTSTHRFPELDSVAIAPVPTLPRRRPSPHRRRAKSDPANTQDLQSYSRIDRSPREVVPPLVRRTRLDDLRREYWQEVSEWIVLETDNNQSAAELTGRTFELAFQNTEFSQEFGFDVRSWLMHVAQTIVDDHLWDHPPTVAGPAIDDRPHIRPGRDPQPRRQNRTSRDTLSHSV